MEATADQAELRTPDTEGPTEIGDIAKRIIDRMNAMPPEQIQADKQREHEQAERERQYRIYARLRAFLASCGVAASGYSLSNYRVTGDKQRAVMDAINAYVETWSDTSRPNIVLYGPVGTGKDHLAIGTAGRLIKRCGISAKWVSGQDLFGNIRDRMDGEGGTERALVGEMVSPDVLIISDPLPPFGSLTQHQAAMLFRIIDRRYCECRSTWVTVNVKSDDEADERMGAQSWDRLGDGAWKIRCEWPSHRKPARTVNC